MGQYDAQLKKIMAEKANPYPTAEIGEIVVWHPANDMDHKVPAVVVERERPGIVTIRDLRSPFAPIKKGVHWHEHPIHLTPTEASRRSGSWTYKSSVARPPKRDYQYHLDLLASQEDSLLRAQAKAEEIEAAKNKLAEGLSAEG